MEIIQIIGQPIISEKYINQLQDGFCGGLVTFEGRIRTESQEGKMVSHLHFDVYEPMGAIGSVPYSVSEAEVIHNLVLSLKPLSLTQNASCSFKLHIGLCHVSHQLDIFHFYF